jgi:UTP--glucose-1-phosphate uridylyltransferase
VFDLLEAQDPGAGGEIQLTDSMAKLMESQDFHAFAYGGRSYDCGDKVNYLRAVAAFALKNADLGAEARRALLEELDRAEQPALRAAR